MDCPNIAHYWRSGAGKRYMKTLEELFRPRQDGEQAPLRILSMNIDAIITKAGYEFAERFLLATKAIFIIDESDSIKNQSALRTKKIMSLRRKAVAWRIMTGTPITKEPADIFQQFEFMHSGLLGTTSYRAFKAEYADLVDIASSMEKQALLVRAKAELEAAENATNGDARSMERLSLAQDKLNRVKATMTSDDYKATAMAKNNPKVAYAQIVMKNADGTPRWRNLDKLQKLIEPHSFRVLKKDCLDLPEKIYENVYFDLDPKQQAAYDLMQEEYRIELTPNVELSVSELASLVKLQQITSGFVMLPGGGELKYVSDKNPRLEALLEIVERTPGKVIIWARFKEELRAIAEALRGIGRNVVEYHGGVNEADREIAVDSFQNGDVTDFVGQPQSGGIGLTLTAASLVIYYSNSFNRRHRWQSEDRAHRIGTKSNVVYIDLIANDTVDEKIASVLQQTAKMAATILGDDRK
jgi:SNF2 family DNA or RNA helicase